MPLFLVNAGVVVGIVFGALAVLGLLFLALWFTARKRLKSIPKQLRETFDTYYTQLTTSCRQSVDRLGKLGKFSPDYQQKYLAKKEQYDKILNERGKDVKDSLNSMDGLISDKDWRSLRSNLPDFQKGVEDFHGAVSRFSLDLSSLLQDENDTFSGSVSVQEKNRKAREFYEENKEALSPISESFSVIFAEADNDFKKFNELANQGKFKDAQASLEDINGALTALIQIEDKLPLLTASLYSVLPQKRDSLLEKNENRIKDGFVIEYREVPDKVRERRIEVATLCARLKNLDVEGIDSRIQALSKEINNLEAQFCNEEKAKQEFLSGQDILSSSSYQLEKRFSRSMDRLDEYKKYYCIDEKYIRDRNGLKGVIENINLLKTKLDSYTGTGRKESYIVIVRIRNERRRGRQKAEKTRNAYDEYIKSIRKKTGDTFKEIRDTYYRLKVGEKTLRERNVASSLALYLPRFRKREALAKKGTDILSVVPIDLNALAETNDELQSSTSALLKEVEEQNKERELSEAAIVTGNLYRQNFTDANSLLDQAEKSFREGDFERAFSEATRVIQRRKTDNRNPSAIR